MAQTLSEAFHDMLRHIRALNIAVEEVALEFDANNQITEQKLRRVMTMNADTYDQIQQKKAISGMGPYASAQLTGLDLSVIAPSTQAAMIAFRNYGVANTPIPVDNGYDAAGRTVNRNVTILQMPDLSDELNALKVATDWVDI